MMVLVTGAGGFVGNALTEHLISRGYSVRAMVRRPEYVERVTRLGAEAVVADLNDIESLTKAISGVEQIFHIAALFRQAGLPSSEYYKVNVDGLKNVLDIAIKENVKKVIHCSTVGVMGDVENPPADESTPYSPGDHYQISKMEGEKLFLSYVNEGKIKGSVIRPAMIYGPNDTRTLKLFKGIAEKKFFYVGEGNALVHFIDVRDLAASFRLAAESETVNGEIFIISGETCLPLNEVASILASLFGVSKPWLHLPVKPMQIMGDICEAICTPLKINPPLYRRRVDFFTKNRAFDSTKAHKLLGFKPSQALVQELIDIISSYIKSGAIDGSKLKKPVAVLRDLDGKILSWCDCAKKAYGWNKEQAVGANAHTLFSTSFPKELGEINKQLEKTGSWSGILQSKSKEGQDLKVQSKWQIIKHNSSKEAFVLETNQVL